MVRYAGGKKKISKQVCDVIQILEKELGQNNNDYLEPFIGFGAVAIELMKREIIGDLPSRKYHLTELNPDIVAFWEGLKGNWEPPKIVTLELYNKLSANRRSRSLRDEKSLLNKAPSAISAYVGNAFSFNGTYFGSFRGKYQSEEITTRENKSTYDEVMRMKSIVQYCDVEILKPESCFDLDLDKISKGKRLTIYCDPPYEASLKKMNNNKYFSRFDVQQFWDTMREWSKKHLVIISEDMENVPSGFQKVWEKQVYRNISSSSKKKFKTESLFVHDSWLTRLAVP